LMSRVSEILLREFNASQLFPLAAKGQP
jgi:hypothetical protein